MAGIEPTQCFVCGSLPKVGSFLLMDGRTGWTCLCPGRCFETDAYLDRDGAVTEWNSWVEGEGVWAEDEDEDGEW